MTTHAWCARATKGMWIAKRKIAPNPRASIHISLSANAVPSAITVDVNLFLKLGTFK
ncbi:hypothetical protein DPMN_077343 [Dreissena polymorpha]|nr:hypothetical protein DPMN_077343 [Dreissena polymorpha]